MISFLTQESGGAEKLAKTLSAEAPEFYEEIFEIAESFSDFPDEECEFGFSLFESLLLVRIYDGEMYTFVYPIALADGADEREALLEIGRYAAREEIPLVFCDVPFECVSTLEDTYRFTKTYNGDESCTVIVESELSHTPEIPFVSDGDICLSELCEEDIPHYARLCRDRELNKYWGYDVHEDAPDASDEYFYETARRAAGDGTALSLAVNHRGKFIGEAVIWGFDLHGSAELAFRILPEFHGCGFGNRTLSLLIRLGDELGLTEMRASVKNDNLPSVRLLDGQMVCCFKNDSIRRYLHKYR